MGKGKRSRENKATDILTSAAPKNKNSDSMGVWTKVLLVAVILIIVASVALTYIGTSGLLLRAPKAFKSENYSINGAMMQYMFYSQYSAFVSSYSSYLSTIGLNTSASLKTQNCNATYQSLYTSLYGEDIKTDGTWFDFFWHITKNQAKQTLAFCEAAKASGMELTDEEKATIKDSLKALDETAASYGYPNTQSYITAMYGTGVTKSDIKQVLTLTALSSKYYNAEIERIDSEITETQVNDYYGKNSTNYLKADYYSLTFQATKDVATADTDETARLKKFEEAIANVKKYAEDIVNAANNKTATKESIEKHMINYWVNDYYDSYLKTTEDELKKSTTTTSATITDADIPTDDAVKAANKEKVIAAVKEAIEKKTAAADRTSFGDTNYDKVLNSLRDKLISQIEKNLDSMLVEKVAYSDSNDASKWIFTSEEAKTKGAAKAFGDDSAEGFNASTASTYKIVAYIIEKPVYRQEEAVKEFGHILITADSFKEQTSDATEKDNLAKAKADELLAQFVAGAKTKEAFEALAKDNTQDSGIFYDDVRPGDMVDEIDEFIFSAAKDEVKVIKTTYGYHVTWLVNADGSPVWFVDAKSDLCAELVEDWTKATEAAYAITENASIADKISA